MFVLPILYFTFIATTQQKNKFYRKILRFLNSHNNPNCVFFMEQLEFFNYILLLTFAYLYIEDFSYLETTEFFFVIGFTV